MGQSEMAKAISRRLLNAINDSQLSYSEIEKLSGVPKSAIQRYANSLTDSIPIDRLVAICKAISIDPKYIMGWDLQSDTSEEHYYLDEEARDAAEFLFHNPDYRVLFDASRNVKKEDIDFVAEMIRRATGQTDD